MSRNILILRLFPRFVIHLFSLEALMSLLKKKVVDDSEIIIDGTIREPEHEVKPEVPKKPFLKTVFGKAVISCGALCACVGIFVGACFLIGNSMISSKNYDGAVKSLGIVNSIFGNIPQYSIAQGLKEIDSGNSDEGVGMLLNGGAVVNIKFNLNGGRFSMASRSETVTLSDPQAYGSLYKATKDHYEFLGWEASRVEYKHNSENIVDITFEALYEPEVYTLSFANIFEGEIDSPKTYTVETDTITINSPKRTGYSFTHWQGSDLVDEPAVIVIPQGSFGNKSYIANWTPNEYVVTFKTDGTYKIPKTQTVVFDNDYKLPEITKRGYDLVGWNDGSSTYLSGVWKTAKNVEVTPSWKVKVYKLTYDLVGGKLASSNKAEYTVEDADFSISEPTKFGYTFQGWSYTGQNGAKKNVVIKKNTIGDIAFKAVWKGNPHKVTLDPNGGSVSPTVYNVTFGSQYELPEPTRKGYDFAGWYSGNTKMSIGTWNQDSDARATAKWTARKYNVSLNADGGTCYSSNVEVTYDSAYNLPTPTRTGYTFQGWYNGSTQYSSGIWTTDKNIELKAKWKGNQYTVTLDANGGKLDRSTVKVTFGDEYSLPEPYKKGYTLTAWMNGYSELTSGKWDIPNNVTLRAKWEVSKYKITYDANGGTCSTTTQTVEYGSTYSLATPTRKGYTFQGWYRGSTAFSPSYYSTWDLETDITLTAKWQGNTYRVSFQPNGGTCSTSYTNVIFGNSITLPVPKRTGYTFLGWYNGSTKVESGTWEIDSNVTLTAKWEQAKYEVKLNANGGTCSGDKLTVTYGGSYTLPTPTRAGYTFNGWYSGSTRYSSGVWNKDSGAELTASWTANQYPLTLNANGGSVTSQYVYVTYDANYSLPIPTKVGYTFSGWYKGSTLISNTGKWSYTEGGSLTASWEVATYTLTLDAAGGDVSQSSYTLKYGDSYSLPTPTRVGYEFAGWYIGNAQVYSGTWLREGDATAVAHWSANTYTIYLDLAGGNCSQTVVYVKYDQRISLPSPVKFGGYLFTGWTLNGSDFANGTVYTYTHDITLVAQYREDHLPV